MRIVPPNQSPIPRISIPPPIFQHHQNIELHVDYFYVNPLPYTDKMDQYKFQHSTDRGKYNEK